MLACKHYLHVKTCWQHQAVEILFFSRDVDTGQSTWRRWMILKYLTFLKEDLLEAENHLRLGEDSPSSSPKHISLAIIERVRIYRRVCGNAEK